jgi:hypothetical protein
MMTIVEHLFATFHWGAGLRVERGTDCLLVGAHSPGWSFPEALAWSKDPWSEYQKAPSDWSKGRVGTRPPQMRFANADTDENLIAFVKEFGPVVVRNLRYGQTDRGEDPSVMVAEQDLNELRAERILYRAALTLILELKKTKPDKAIVVSCIREVASKVEMWPQQWERERSLRKGSVWEEPGWRFSPAEGELVEVYASSAAEGPPADSLKRAFSPSSDPINAGHAVLCELVNAFRFSVYRWGDRVIEGPDTDLRYGIRPLLYLILRRVYLEGGIAVCANDRCRKLFEIDRAGQRFCETRCSLNQRQRDRWAVRGKELRRLRRENERVADHKAGIKKKEGHSTKRRKA